MAGPGKLEELKKLASSVIGPKVAIWYERSPIYSLHQDFVPEYPKDALVRYSGLFSKEISSNNNLGFVTISETKDTATGRELVAHIQVLKWILESAIAGSPADFKIPKTFAAYADIFDSAELLQVAELQPIVRDKVENLCEQQQIEPDDIKEVYRIVPSGHLLCKMVVASISKALESDILGAPLHWLDVCDKFPEFEAELTSTILERQRERVSSSWSVQVMEYWRYKIFKTSLLLGSVVVDVSQSQSLFFPPADAAIIVPPDEDTVMDSSATIQSDISAALAGIAADMTPHVNKRSEEKEKPVGGAGDLEIGSDDDDDESVEIPDKGVAKNKKRRKKAMESSRAKRKR